MKKLSYLLCIAIVVISCKNTAIVYNDPIPEHDSLTIDSKFVNETRVINVWTPPNYQVDTTNFPVLYMPDGGIKEDFPHIANTLEKLILEKQIPPYILVGIENTKRQRDLTGYTGVENDKEIADETGESANFRAFITQELIPKINSRYKTSAKKGIIGESLAGLFVTETFLLQPASFDFYIAFDPSLWWNNHNYDINVETYLNNLPKTQTKIWFASSDVEGMQEATHNLAEAFKKVTPKNKLIWKYSDEPDEAHHTIFRAAKEKALIWTLND
ncbi:alpha/beta hydrolase [Bizionia sp. KMM 8389]